jgi:hypothetical protein
MLPVAPTDRQIDALYQVTPGEFTAGRTALAKTLSGADAKKIRGLKKPTAVPWAVNQVFWKARPIYDRVMKTGQALRSAQIAALKGRKADVRGAAEAHRKAVGEAVHHAQEFASGAGLGANVDPLARMFEAVSLASAPPADAGRFTQRIEPSGFDALAGVTLAGGARALSLAPRTETGSEPKKPSAADLAAERRKAEQERRRHEEAEADLKIATRGLERARSKEQTARQALERAEEEVTVAERAVTEARLKVGRG